MIDNIQHLPMKIERKEIGLFIGGILALSLLLLLIELRGNADSYEGGSHGVYDHAELI